MALPTAEKSPTCTSTVRVPAPRTCSILRFVCLALLVGHHASLVCAQVADNPTPPVALPRYSDVRLAVSVKNAAEISWHAPRPAGFYQLAGARDQQLCGQALEAFNEPGKYRGEDTTRWLLDNSRQVEFRRLPSANPYYERPASAIYVFPGLEYARVDINADGADEHVYRLNGVRSSQWYQRLMIVPDELQVHPELLTEHAERCEKLDPSAGCDFISTKILFALTARVPDRLPNEWAFTREDALYRSTEDARSEQLIDRPADGAPRRNVGYSTGVYWSLYRLDTAVVAVSAPIQVFAPPELLVFAPSRQRNGILQCVIMPVAWHDHG